MMKNIICSGLWLLFGCSAVFGQSLADAKKAIDAEQYSKSKFILKGLIQSKPVTAENYFYLGNVYLKTGYIDSARIAYNRGVAANAESPLNYVGLGELALSVNPVNARPQFDKALSLTGKKDNQTLLYIGRAYTLASRPDAQAAVAALEKAKAINSKDAEVYLLLGDAYRIQAKNSDAYSSYRTALDLDKSLLRAIVELGVINRLSKAFGESVNELNRTLALDPDYGPAYRELAETYYRWGDAEPKTYDAKINQAVAFYGKYMDLTDRSLESRERYATFLILAKKYKELEQEANAMARMDKTNPRILRYLGYSAFENGHYDASIEALKEFIVKVDSSRIISQDYLYLGRSMMKLPGSESEGLSNLKKAIKLDSTSIDLMSDIGKALYSARKFKDAAQIFQLAVQNPKSKTITYDNFYLGMSHYFDYASQVSAKEIPTQSILNEADSAFSYVIRIAPDKPDSYLYRARVKKLLDDPKNMQGLMVPDFEMYLEVVLADPAATSEPRVKNAVIEAYKNLGAFYQRSDLAKAKDYFKKVLKLAPSDAYSKSALIALGS